MKVAIGADHAGFELKEHLAARLTKRGVNLLDVGAHAYDASDDYPDFAFGVADAVSAGTVDRGIVICGSGVGACVAANKVPGVRAAICHDAYSAHQGVEHDDMNVLCLGSRIVGSAVAEELVDAFLGATFSGEDRHLRRKAKVEERERVRNG